MNVQTMAQIRAARRSYLQSLSRAQLESEYRSVRNFTTYMPLGHLDDHAMLQVVLEHDYGIDWQSILAE